MSGEKWTPGPWAPDIVESTVTVACVYQHGATPLVDSPVAVIRSRGYENETIAANAHLIASAPRLYAALDALCWAVENAHVDMEGLTEARAALAAARGETP